MDKDLANELIHEYAIDRGGRYGVLVPEGNFGELAGAICQAHEEEMAGLRTLAEVEGRAATAYFKGMRVAEDEADKLRAQVAVMAEALREAETLLTNYLASNKFPHGSDCEEVRDIVRQALSAAPKVLARLDMQLAKVPGGERILVTTGQEAWLALGVLEFEYVYDVLVVAREPEGEQSVAEPRQPSDSAEEKKQEG